MQFILAFTIVDFLFWQQDKIDKRGKYRGLLFKNLFRVPRYSSELRQQLNEILCSDNPEKVRIVCFWHIFHMLSFKYVLEHKYERQYAQNTSFR